MRLRMATTNRVTNDPAPRLTLFHVLWLAATLSMSAGVWWTTKNLPLLWRLLVVATSAAVLFLPVGMVTVAFALYLHKHDPSSRNEAESFLRPLLRKPRGKQSEPPDSKESV